MAELETVRQFKTPEPSPTVKISFSPHGEVYSFVVGATTIEFPEAFWGPINASLKFKVETVFPTSARSAVLYRWDFGDGHEGSGVEASHTYLQKSENLSVVCVVTDNFGIEWTSRKSMYVH